MATPQTRPFPLKEQYARYLFFFHNLEYLWAAAMSGATLVKVIFKKHYQAQKGTAKDILQPCERIIKDGLSSSQMHAFKSGKPCFHASMQSDYSFK